VRLYRHQLRAEQLIFWRSRESAIFIFIFPVMLFLLLASIYSGHIFGLPAVNAILAGMIGYGCANTAFAGLAITLVIRRENGVLKRIRSTPLPTPTYVASLLSSTLIVFVLQTIVLVVLGIVAYDARSPDRILSLLLVVAFGAVAFAGLGVGAAALIHSAEGASAVINVILLPMAFLTGAFGPTRHYPSVLKAIGDVLPLKYFIDLVYAVYLHDHAFWSKPGAIAVVTAWGLGGLAVAARRFRWEPHGT
jgi:ABC-2 type transport system permease protein